MMIVYINGSFLYYKCCTSSQFVCQYFRFWLIHTCPFFKRSFTTRRENRIGVSNRASTILFCNFCSILSDFYQFFNLFPDCPKCQLVRILSKVFPTVSKICQFRFVNIVQFCIFRKFCPIFSKLSILSNFFQNCP